MKTPNSDLLENEISKTDFLNPIDIGKCKTVAFLKSALITKKCNLSSAAYEVICSPSFTLSGSEKSIFLVVKSVYELGLRNGATLGDIYHRSKLLGLNLCPSDVGPELRHQYLNQPNKQSLHIAMKPAINPADSRYVIFSVECANSILFLDVCPGSMECFWGPKSLWVFVSQEKII